jgi:hypothetical protein
MVPSPLVGEGKGEGAWILGENPVRRYQEIIMTIIFITLFISAGTVLVDPMRANGQTSESTALSREGGRDPFLLPPGVHLLSKIGATSGRTNSQPGDIPSRSFMLTAILISDHARLALIDRHIVTVGDSVHGEKVLEIKTDRVILGKGEQKKTLLLAQSPVRLTVEQSPPLSPPTEKGGRTSLEIPVASTRNRAARQTPPEGPSPPGEHGGVISNGVKEEVKGEDR